MASTMVGSVSLHDFIRRVGLCEDGRHSEAAEKLRAAPNTFLEPPPAPVVVSVGSAEHDAGNCSICGYVAKGKVCPFGAECTRCHLPHSNRRSRRKRIVRPCKHKRAEFQRALDDVQEQLSSCGQRCDTEFLTVDALRDNVPRVIADNAPLMAKFHRSILRLQTEVDLGVVAPAGSPGNKENELEVDRWGAQIIPEPLPWTSLASLARPTAAPLLPMRTGPCGLPGGEGHGPETLNSPVSPWFEPWKVVLCDGGAIIHTGCVGV
mmetsp:Transcript_38590/g.87753  ORF Transcript_38590/g.87753 Transcript_38590/m.87753 type:complete len:264 (-) Transcript_38590:37-828(-)